jgi:hypothetical protein
LSYDSAVSRFIQSLNQPRCTVSKSIFVETHNTVRNKGLSNYGESAINQRLRTNIPRMVAELFVGVPFSKSTRHCRKSAQCENGGAGVEGNACLPHCSAISEEGLPPAYGSQL